MSPKEELNGPTNVSKIINISLIVLKILEMILAILCIALIDDPVIHSSYKYLLNQRTIGICYVTFGVFCIYTGIYLLTKLFGDTTPWKATTLWSLVGLVLFLACASLLLNQWRLIKDRSIWHPNTPRLDSICAVGFISLFAAVIFLIDIVVTIRWGIRGDID